MTINTIKILLASVATFSIAYLLAPHYIRFLTRHEMWKKKSVALTTDGKVAEITSKIHNDENKKSSQTWWSYHLVFSIYCREYILVVVRKYPVHKQNRLCLT
jgi:hypothetical protein